VCTTIIENGLDIPRANTIIINHADRFGLAQLYQLRGRVGRGAIRAYAYLLYDKGRHLSPEARRRLEAIYEASELGAGFRVAMQDLELRGAGELLGARQHGHIAAIGFDLYARLLAKTIQELKERGEMDLPETSPSSSALQPQGDPLPPAVQMDLPLSAYLPESYVSDEPLRLQLYRRIAELNSPEAIETMKQELRDRFGPVPEPVEQLLYVVRMRMLARQAGVERIGRQEGMLVLYGKAIEAVDRLTLQNRLDDGVRVGKRSVYIPMDAHWPTRLERALEVLSRR
jgi:Transcription-repair coupling factor (superfamily II helicase)